MFLFEPILSPVGSLINEPNKCNMCSLHIAWESVFNFLENYPLTLGHLVSMQPWTSHFTLLSFHFLICKMGLNSHNVIHLIILSLCITCLTDERVDGKINSDKHDITSFKLQLYISWHTARSSDKSFPATNLISLPSSILRGIQNLWVQIGIYQIHIKLYNINLSKVN